MGTIVSRYKISIMASSSMVAVWEAKAEQESAEEAKNNTRKVRPRLGSNRRKGSTAVSGGGGSLESLDDILLSLQNAIVINEDNGEQSTEEEKVSKDEKDSNDVITNKTILQREVSMKTETNENIKVDAEGLVEVKHLDTNEEKILDSKLSKGNIIRQISRTKDLPQKTDPGKVSRQNSREFVPKSPRPNKDNPFLGKQTKTRKNEPKMENEMNGDGDKDLSNDGVNTLARALKSLRSTQSFEEKEEENETIADEPDHVYPTEQTDIVQRKVDDASADPFSAKRQSARLSLQNTLEIVPENEPIDTQDDISELTTKTENFDDLMEKLKKCKEFDSFKSACLSTFVALNKTLEDVKSSLHKEETPVVTSGPPITAPPPPPPPGPPALDLTPRKLVITKTSKPKPSLA